MSSPALEVVMIFVDATDVTSASRLPVSEILAIATASNTLERVSGADFLITPLSVRPVSANVVKRHVEAGALLVQRKSVADFLSSLFGGRLDQQFVRMRNCGASTTQCVLLTAGIFLPNRKHNVRVGSFDGQRIHWKHTKYKWSSFRAKSSCLQDSGLRWEQLATDEEIPSWLAMKERHVIEHHKNPIKQVYDRALREMRPGDDWWYNLTIIEGVGIVKAQVIGEFLEALGCGTLADALEYLTDLRNASQRSRPKGIGPSIFNNTRDLLGLKETDVVIRTTRNDVGITRNERGRR